MGSGRNLEINELRRKYKGYPLTLDALLEAQRIGWCVRDMGHGAKVFCPQETRDGCSVSVAGTPRNDDNQAKRLRRFVAGCCHTEESGEEGEITEG